MSKFLKGYDRAAQQAILWKLLSVSCFSLANLMVRLFYLQGAKIEPVQIIFLQSFLPCLFMTFYAVYRHPKQNPLRNLLGPAPMLAVVRGIFSALSLFLWFNGLKKYPLPLMMTLHLLSPFLIFIASFLLLKEQRFQASFLSFGLFALSALLIFLSQFFHSISLSATYWPDFLIMAITFLISLAGAQITSKKMSDSVSTFQATYSLFGLTSLLLAPLTFLVWRYPTAAEWPTIITVVFLDTIAHTALYKAFMASSLHKTALLSLYRFCFAAVLSTFFLGEPLSKISLVILFFMACGNILMLRK